MTEKFKVSFNSPQCGWMSVGFSAGENEFHTTTACAPHETALSELLTSLAELLDRDVFERVIKWNRDPEEYDFVFRKTGGNLALEIIEYPTAVREISETVFSYNGNAKEICRAFFSTFEQLLEESSDDEFEQNWRQPFPLTQFEDLRNKLN